MRKAIIAAIVATALFAVGAFAASFAVDSEDIASGTNPVQACATNVEISFSEPVTPTLVDQGRWVVTTATAWFYNGTRAAPELAAACAGFDAELALDLDTTTPPNGTADLVRRFGESQVAEVDGKYIATFTISTAAAGEVPAVTTYADQILRASVVVDDAILTGTPPVATPLD